MSSRPSCPLKGLEEKFTIENAFCEAYYGLYPEVVIFFSSQVSVDSFVTFSPYHNNKHKDPKTATELFLYWHKDPKTATELFLYSILPLFLAMTSL